MSHFPFPKTLFVCEQKDKILGKIYRFENVRPCVDLAETPQRWRSSTGLWVQLIGGSYASQGNVTHRFSVYYL